MSPSTPERLVVLGRITGVFGVLGWVKVHSDTDPPDNIRHYSPWLLCRGETVTGWYRLQASQWQHKGLVVQLDGYTDRAQAATLVGLDIAIERQHLPPPAPDEFYWTDLEGLAVETVTGVALGRVHHLLDTGANAVVVVRGERERLVPFIWEQVIREVDFTRGRLLVDWDPTF